MMKKDFHMHTRFCDGRDTPEEMVCAAIEKGFSHIGICAHSYTFFDESYCLKKEQAEKYRLEIARLKECYKDKIQVFCGIEQDFYSTEPTDVYDYVIGSVHYVKVGDNYLPVDETPELLQKEVKEYFGGDFYAFCEKYFETVGNVAEQTNADIIGHFDLITKFNEGGCLFDESDERYIAAWKKSADKLLQSGAVFEINTGAISRGYRTAPYPAQSIISYLKANGAKLILSSDAHSADTIGFGFEKYRALADEEDVLF